MNYIITVRICFYLEKCKYNFYQESIPIIFSKSVFERYGFFHICRYRYSPINLKHGWLRVGYANMRVFAHSLDTICIGYGFVHCSKCILFLFPTTTTTTVVLVHTLLWCGNSLNLSNQRTKKLTRHIPKQKMLKLIIVYCPFEACQMQVQVRQWLKDVKLT